MKPLMRVCDIHRESYDNMKQWKCNTCLAEMADAELKAQQSKGAQDIARKQKGRTK